MFKKILCLAMILVMVASMAVIGVSAAEDTKIYFELPSNWNNVKKVFCHVWPYGGDPFFNWQSKKESCVDEGNGIYSYDTTKLNGFGAGTYCVIFSADTGMQTYDTLFGTACLGDTVYCDGTTLENPEDSSKTCIAAYWKNQPKNVYGPVLAITSIGNIVGSCAAESGADMFTAFITGPKLGNARTYSGKTDQAIIDDAATALGLGQDTVEKLIKESGVTDIAWAKAESAAPEKDDASKVPSNPAATATGQETTIVYIAIAMMLASAAVVFFARKKRVTE